MNRPDPQLITRLAHAGQEHLLRWWDELDPESQQRLIRQIERIDFAQIHRLVRDFQVLQSKTTTPSEIDPNDLEAAEVHRLPGTDSQRGAWRRAIELGEQMLSAGRVAIVIVAGGQGSRLGFEGPKGIYPIGPVTGASLFQIHAEKILALGERFGTTPPVYIMTSPGNDQQTRDFFAEHQDFGLPQLRFFVQGQIPAVDLQTGKILLQAKDQVALSPDGHGGTIAALNRPGPDGQPSCLDEMEQAGIERIFYFQVDNPMVRVADPSYLGLHCQSEAEASAKVVEKNAPEERIGVVVRRDGLTQVIEYSDLPEHLAKRRDSDGRLTYWAGSIAIHIFDRAFLKRMADSASLPFHFARKKVSYLDDDGRLVQPEKPNAVKFETFIFDCLPQASSVAVVETERNIEFEPLKNADGDSSPASVRRQLTNLFADWLEAAGAKIARQPDGGIPFFLEISPRLALEADQLRGRISDQLVLECSTYFGPDGTLVQPDAPRSRMV